jgi:transcriptional regulator with XRE-family HTH domain
MIAVMAESLGERIRLRRQALRWTQQQLADRLGVNRATVSAWERGKQLPDRTQGAIEAVLGVSLANGTGKAPFVPADDDEARIWAMAEPEEWRRKLIAWKRQGQTARAVS